MTVDPPSSRGRGVPLVIIGSSLAILSPCIVPCLASFLAFQIAHNGETAREAPFIALDKGMMTAVSCTLVSGFPVMLTAWLTVRGRTRRTRVVQIVGLVLTALLAAWGLLLGSTLFTH